MDVSLRQIIHKLNEANVGILVCVDAFDSIVGIISERDVVRSIARHGDEALSMPVSTFMTRDVVACNPADEVAHLLIVMTETRCRHLPVVSEGQLIGLVSIGDLVKVHLHSRSE